VQGTRWAKERRDLTESNAPEEIQMSFFQINNCTDVINSKSLIAFIYVIDDITDESAINTC
jgi:hypothetical protein